MVDFGKLKGIEHPVAVKSLLANIKHSHSKRPYSTRLPMLNLFDQDLTTAGTFLSCFYCRSLTETAFRIAKLVDKQKVVTCTTVVTSFLGRPVKSILAGARVAAGIGHTVSWTCNTLPIAN